MVLPPDTEPLPIDWLNKLEGYINAIKMQKDAFDTSGFRCDIIAQQSLIFLEVHSSRGPRLLGRI